MHRESFLGEVNRRHLSPECHEKRHNECSGFQQKKEWTDREYACDCLCHQPQSKADRITRSIARGARKQTAIEPEE
jgi:hypothetical protein